LWISICAERLRDAYSRWGVASIDPEILCVLLLVGYLYGITSERRLVGRGAHALAYRWFARLGFEQEIPITLLSPRIERPASARLGFSWTCLRRSCGGARRLDWYKASADRWMNRGDRERQSQRGTKPEQLEKWPKVPARCASI